MPRPVSRTLKTRISASALPGSGLALALVLMVGGLTWRGHLGRLLFAVLTVAPGPDTTGRQGSNRSTQRQLGYLYAMAGFADSRIEHQVTCIRRSSARASGCRRQGEGRKGRRIIAGLISLKSSPAWSGGRFRSAASGACYGCYGLFAGEHAKRTYVSVA